MAGVAEEPEQHRALWKSQGSTMSLEKIGECNREESYPDRALEGQGTLHKISYPVSVRCPAQSIKSAPLGKSRVTVLQARNPGAYLELLPKGTWKRGTDGGTIKSFRPSLNLSALQLKGHSGPNPKGRELYLSELESSLL